MGCSPYPPVYGSTVAAGNTAAVMSAAVGRDGAMRPAHHAPPQKV